MKNKNLEMGIIQEPLTFYSCVFASQVHTPRLEWFKGIVQHFLGGVLVKLCAKSETDEKTGAFLSSVP